ncbi:uncharacterized protein BXZ73DRAFT_105765 [Epithele typhae]|uniref:uncharacterized protein n=1 Tax=Epithele typhae TaxID=378194 RepID=UPI002008E98B|nr:uncharacterized protein BXZ73DRAFT_105765 [Epithele typhae]KAH9916571.1 hypothetical protein BXZ73DRAFT_105765 [Epithele typhae]
MFYDDFARAPSRADTPDGLFRERLPRDGFNPVGVSTPSIECTADEEVWVANGDMYVIGQGAHILFRVDSHLLASRSPTLSKSIHTEVQVGVRLKDVEWLGDNCFDSLPVWIVDQDTKVLRFFLKAMMQPPHRVLNAVYRGARIPFEEVVAVARLAHRFDVRHALHAALQHLTKFYTTDFRSHHDHSHSRDLDVPSDECAVAAIQIARLTNTPSILPLAFYLCSLHECPNGYLDPRLRMRFEWRPLHGPVEDLPAEDRDVCLKGVWELCEAMVGRYEKVYDGGAGCREECARARRRLFEATNAHGEYLMTRREEVAVDGLCGKCAADVRARMRRIRVALWNGIPGFFSLPVPRGWRVDE